MSRPRPVPLPVPATPALMAVDVPTLIPPFTTVDSSNHDTLIYTFPAGLVSVANFEIKLEAYDTLGGFLSPFGSENRGGTLFASAGYNGSSNTYAVGSQVVPANISAQLYCSEQFPGRVYLRVTGLGCTALRWSGAFLVRVSSRNPINL